MNNWIAYLIGFWIGDGDINSPYRDQPTLRFKCNLNDLEKVQTACNSLGYNNKVIPYGPGIWYYISPGPSFRTACLAQGLTIRAANSNNKRLPTNWKAWSDEACLQLLSGLIDSDGTIRNPKTQGSAGGTISTQSRGLTEDVMNLCQRLALPARMGEHHRKSRGTVELRVLLHKKAIIRLYKLGVKLQQPKQAHVEFWVRKYAT